MEIFLIIAGIFGYLNAFMMSIMHIKDKDKLKPAQIDRNTKLTSEEWRSIQNEEQCKALIIISPMLMGMFSFMIFVLGLDPFETNPWYGADGIFITAGVILILLFTITIGRIFYRIIEAQHSILTNVGIYR